MINIKTQFGIVEDVKIGDEYCDYGSYELGKIKHEGDDGIFGCDIPIEDDPVWRFWICFEDDSCEAEISEEDKELIKEMFRKRGN